MMRDFQPGGTYGMPTSLGCAHTHTHNPMKKEKKTLTRLSPMTEVLSGLLCVCMCRVDWIGGRKERNHRHTQKENSNAGATELPVIAPGRTEKEEKEERGGLLSTFLQFPLS